ncbi:YdeI family protein [Nocardioides sp. Arc9.136]|uniref:YdeI/OmpD-associated family protein n=1 Tax=Nocardioides sp. Arc9.136 TaxID=2996826 RepID=UPI002666C494|nr:YdeI/OmpD-associated family protein [Nocardioides sp. Arc9.136]WKN48808.1 YdeI/OmpD-associated family protein [Nocardioides sp. Arc9.136]
MATPKQELEELLVPDAAAWRAWLEQHHADSPGVWLVLTKKGGEVTSLTRADALDEALCFGWIDGQARSRDAASSLQRMTRRTPSSRWSQVNVGVIARLEAEGRMAAAGRAAVEAAQADGRWEAAYAPPSTAEVPADLLAAVAADPQAQAMFDVLTKSNRYALVHRLGAVKRAETRERKIAEYVAMLARQETIYPQRARP